MRNNPSMDAFQKQMQQQAKRPAIRAAGVDALLRLVPVAQRDTGQSGVVGRFLLGLYNGRRYPFDLTELRSLDSALFEHCIAVLRLDNSPEQEVHTYIHDGEAVWEDLRRHQP
jgi:hypothetical protein